MFVEAHCTGLNGSANALAGGIQDRMIKAFSKACVHPHTKHRPLMKDIYLHLACAVEIGNDLTKRGWIYSGGGAGVIGSPSFSTLRELQEIS